MSLSSLPPFLEKLFWDVPFDHLTMAKSRDFILKRILDHGDEQSIVWMRQTFSGEEIKNCLKKYRGFSRKSANFWALIYDIQKDAIPCLKRHLSKNPGIIWPY